MDIDPRLLCGRRKGGGRWRGREGDERDTVRSAEREERERRRAEARRYPIDDTELLAELREKAYVEGTPPSRPIYPVLLARTPVADLCIARVPPYRRHQHALQRRHWLLCGPISQD